MGNVVYIETTLILGSVVIHIPTQKLLSRMLQIQMLQGGAVQVVGQSLAVNVKFLV